MSSWTSNDWSILLASCAGLIGACCAGARLSNCVKVALGGPNGWLYIERVLRPVPADPAQLPRTASEENVSVSV